MHFRKVNFEIMMPLNGNCEADCSVTMKIIFLFLRVFKRTYYKLILEYTALSQEIYDKVYCFSRT